MNDIVSEWYLEERGIEFKERAIPRVREKEREKGGNGTWKTETE